MSICVLHVLVIDHSVRVMQNENAFTKEDKWTVEVGFIRNLTGVSKSRVEKAK